MADLDSWMPESVDIFDDHLNIPELKSGFINHYNIEDNIRMIQAFYPKTEAYRFYLGQYLRRRDHAGTGAEGDEKVPRNLDLILMDGPAAYDLYDCRGAAASAGEYGDHGGHVAGGYERRLFHAERHVCDDGGDSDHSGVYALIGESGVLGDRRCAAGLPEGGERTWRWHPSGWINQAGGCGSSTWPMIGSKAVLDSRKVKEWGVDPDIALPFDVELVNQPVSFYQQYTVSDLVGVCSVCDP